MKNYEEPILAEVKVIVEDVVASSNIVFGDNQIGDFEAPFPFKL